LGEDAVQLPESKEAVDLAIDVLDARVGNHGGAIAILGEILRCLDEDLTGGLRLEAQTPWCLGRGDKEIIWMGRCV
jgi:hypothetical protein